MLRWMFAPILFLSSADAKCAPSGWDLSPVESDAPPEVIEREQARWPSYAAIIVKQSIGDGLNGEIRGDTGEAVLTFVEVQE